MELCDVETAWAQADVVVLLVDHREFKTLVNPAAAGKRVIDTRGVWF